MTRNEQEGRALWRLLGAKSSLHEPQRGVMPDGCRRVDCWVANTDVARLDAVLERLHVKTPRRLTRSEVLRALLLHALGQLETLDDAAVLRVMRRGRVDVVAGLVPTVGRPSRTAKERRGRRKLHGIGLDWVPR